jgi:hypothetical protein
LPSADGRPETVKAMGEAIAKRPKTKDADTDLTFITKYGKRWVQKSDIEPTRNRMMKEARKQGMPKADAQSWTYAELDRLHPPVATLSGPFGGVHSAASAISQMTGRIYRTMPASPPRLAGCRRSDFGSWKSGQTVVHLARARSPAPSWAALGWLETSVRSYAKFVDVVAKSLTTQQDEKELVQRERLAIDEMREILAEMHQD